MTENNMVLLDQPDLSRDVLCDLFAGCGGSGGGLLDALGILKRKVRGTFVNHWDRAIDIHAANHPEHRHLKEDIFLLDPTSVFPVGTDCSLLWASPQCTFFSVARGASCVNEQDRSHAHSVTDWVKHLRPEAVLIENVAEFLSWSPVVQKRQDAGIRKGELMWTSSAKPIRELPRGINRRRGETEEQWTERMLGLGYKPYEVPDKARAGEYFNLWRSEMETLGYEADHRLLKSADYGDPTIRRRLFVYFVRRDSGKKIVWPEPYAQDPLKQAVDPRPMNWRTARECIDWDIKGSSVFTRDKKLADNTFRRLAIGLVKYGLKDFLTPQHAGGDKRNTRSVDVPVSTLTTTHSGEGLVEPSIIQMFGASDTQSADTPLTSVTTKGTHGVSQASIIQMKGQSTAQSPDEPLTALTGMQAHYVSQPEVTPMVDNLYGSGVASSPDEPLRAVTAGGSHQAIAEAFMFAIDQTGGSKKNDGTYPIDEPVRTLVTKANQSCIEMELEEVSVKFLAGCGAKGVDTERATTFLNYLVDELKRRGKVDAKPWIYVYYSNGSEGKDIDEPLPTVRTKAGHALVYPVIELEGKLLKIDLFYRMLNPIELQRAMGFPEDMEWGDANKTEKIKAIGNSVSHGVSRALGLAWYSQDPDVWKHVKHLHKGDNKAV